MKIIKISVLNYLGVGTFKTDRLGKLNRIEGDNGTGKSSVVNAIKEAFKSSGVKPELIKIGSDKAEIIIELDDKVLVERTLTAGSNSVRVTVDGQPISKGQTFLNDLLGPFNFNPVDFFVKKEKERRDLLLQSIPFTITAQGLLEALGNGTKLPIDASAVDWSKHGLIVLERVQKAVYDRRHEVGTDLTRLSKSLEQDKAEIPESFNQKEFEAFDFSAAMSELQAGQRGIAQHDADEKRLDSLRAEVVREKEKIADLERQLGEAHLRLESLTNTGKAMAKEVSEFKRPDIESLRAKIDAFQANQKLIHKLEDIRKREAEVQEVESDRDSLDKLYKKLTTDVPRIMLQQVKLPIEGLEIRGDDIFVGGVSVDTLSTSEQVKFAVAVARSLAGKLKVICIDRFESLSRENQKAFEAECSKDDFEYFITNVSDGPLRMSTAAAPLVPEKSAESSAPGKVHRAESKQLNAGF